MNQPSHKKILDDIGRDKMLLIAMKHGTTDVESANWDSSEGQTHYQNDGCGEPAHNDICTFCASFYTVRGVHKVDCPAYVPPTKGIVTAENLEEHMNNLHGVDFHKLSLREEFRDNFLDTFPYRTRDIAEWQEKENIMNWFIGKHNTAIQDMLTSEVLKEEDTHGVSEPIIEGDTRIAGIMHLARNQLRAQFREMLTNLIK